MRRAIHGAINVAHERPKDGALSRLGSNVGQQRAPARIGAFTAGHINPGLTVNFGAWTQAFPKGHCCLRVGDEDFQAIPGRLVTSRIAYRSHQNGLDDFKVNTGLGGSIFYWSQAGGHVRELLTENYARDRIPA